MRTSAVLDSDGILEVDLVVDDDDCDLVEVVDDDEDDFDLVQVPPFWESRFKLYRSVGKA